MGIKPLVFILLFTAYSGYSIFTYTFGTKAPSHAPHADALATKGKLLFQQKNCIACHQIYGLGGYLGPDLTYEMSQPTKGRTYAIAILTAGLNKMPNYHLKQDETDALIAYLTYIDNTARFFNNN